MRQSFWAFCYCFLVIIERLIGSRQQTSHDSIETHTHSLGEKSDVYIRVQSRLRWTKFTVLGVDTEGSEPPSCSGDLPKEFPLDSYSERKKR